MMAWNDRFTVVGGRSDERGMGDKDIYQLSVLKQLRKIVFL